jgi:hypothetical protein
MKSDFKIDYAHLDSPTESQLFWLKQLERWQKTDLSLAEFAKRNQFKYVTLHSWLRWARKTLPVNKTSSPQALLFNKVTVIETESLPTIDPEPLTVSFSLPNGIGCRVESVAQSTVIALITTLAKVAL